MPRVLLLRVRMISNHPKINYSIQMSEIVSLAISFLSRFFFFVNACRSNHTHVGASSSRDNISHGLNLSHVFQTFVWRPCLLRADHREFSVP